MARVIQQAKQTQTSRDESDAYYVAAKVAAGALRKISVIEQMYGYYRAE